VWVTALAILFSACQRDRLQPVDAGAVGQPSVVATPMVGGSGAIAGTVRLLGQRPQSVSIPTSAAVERQCGPSVADQSLILDQAGNLANVIIFLGDAKPETQDATAPRPVTVDQRRCAFLPPVLAARAGSVIELLNSDPLLHNVHAIFKSQPLFNFAMPLQGGRVQKKLPAQPGVIDVRCDVHPWMHATIRIFEHSYFAVSDAQGHYRLEAVPSGRHKLVFWHERLPSRTVDVGIAPGQQLAQDAQWPASDLASKRLSTNEAE
jgi:plastocyanin